MKRVILLSAWGTTGEHAGPCYLAKLLARAGFKVHVMGNFPYAEMYADIPDVVFHPLRRADPAALVQSRFGRTAQLLSAVVDRETDYHFGEACRLIREHNIQLVLSSWITPALFTAAHAMQVPIRPLFLYPLAQQGEPTPIFSNWRRLIGSGRCDYDTAKEKLTAIYRRNLSASEKLRVAWNAPDDDGRVPGTNQPGLNLFPSAISRDPEGLHLHSGFGIKVSEPSDIFKGFLSQGRAPWLLTFGTLLRLYPERADAAIAGLLKAGKRAVIIGASEPRGLFAGGQMLELGFTPMGSLLPHVAGVVHHAGVNTCCETVAAGRVSLFCPIGGDQFDNAAAFTRLGAGRVLTRVTSQDAFVGEIEKLAAPAYVTAVEALRAQLASEASHDLPEVIERWLIQAQHATML